MIGIEIRSSVGQGNQKPCGSPHMHGRYSSRIIYCAKSMGQGKFGEDSGGIGGIVCRLIDRVID